MARRKKKRRKSLAKRIASVGGLNRHAAKYIPGHIPDKVLKKRAARLEKTPGGRKIIKYVLERHG